jgi:opacity protein-like surface antigen
MKKILLCSLIAIAGITASAADITKEDFIKKKKSSGLDEAAAIAEFERKDRNSDGVLSDKEMAPPKPAEKPAAPVKKGKK